MPRLIPPTAGYSPQNWTPGLNIGVTFDDKTAEYRTPDQISEMIRRMRAIANEYDFDLESYAAHTHLRKIPTGD